MSAKVGTEEIDVVILCGGLGSRLKSVITDRPKALVEIGGIPFIDFLINYVAGFGFKRFILCTGYKANQIRQYYKGKRVLNIEIVFSEEKLQLGTGGAVKNAENLIRSNPFLVINGDTFCRLNFERFIDFHFAKKAQLSMVLAKARFQKEGINCGTVKLNNSGLVIRFNEKKEGDKYRDFINSGIYLMDSSLLSNIPSEKKFSFEYELFPSIIKKRFYGYPTNSVMIDIGTPQGLKRAEIYIKRYCFPK